MEEYYQLQQCIHDSFDQICNEMRRKLRSWPSILGALCLSAFVFTLLAGWAIFLPNIASFLSGLSVQASLTAWQLSLVNSRTLLTAMAAILWAFLITFPAALLARKFTRGRSVFVSIQAFIINPGLWVLTAWLLGGKERLTLLADPRLLILGFLVLPLFLVATLLIVLTPTPSALLLLTLSSSLSRLFPKNYRYEAITNRVLREAETTVQGWPPSTWQTVQRLLGIRTGDLNAQVQTVAMGLAIPGLVSLIAAMNPDAIQSLLHGFANYFNESMSLGVTVSSLQLWAIAFLLVLGLIALAYFSHIYKTLCALELARILCALHTPEDD